MRHHWANQTYGTAREWFLSGGEEHAAKFPMFKAQKVGGHMKNPFVLTLADKGDQQPVVVLDKVRNVLIGHLYLDACEGCVPGYQTLLPRVHPLEEERVVLLGRVQGLYEEINAYTEHVTELMKEEKALLCGPCWTRLVHLNDVVIFVQECALQSPLKPFTALLIEEDRSPSV